jgi:cell division protein ZapA (FtsZ GTPase activity inhibitor)
MNQNEYFLNLQLGKRTLTLKAHDDSQLSIFRQAELRINQKMEHYKNKYSIQDESTFYLMICLDFATDLIQTEEKLNQYESHLDSLSIELEQALHFNIHHKYITDNELED